MGQASFLIVGLPIFAGCAAVLFWTILRAVTAGRDWKGGVAGQAAARCGKCGYAVEVLSPAPCPECGSNLLSVGIATRPLAARLRGGLWAALVAWTIIIMTIGVYGLTATSFRRVGMRPAGASVTRSQQLIARADADVRIDLAMNVATGPGGGAAASGKTVAKLVGPVGQGWSLEIDHPNLACRAIDPDNARTKLGTFGPSAVEQWLELSGATKSPAVASDSPSPPPGSAPQSKIGADLLAIMQPAFAMPGNMAAAGPQSAFRSINGHVGVRSGAAAPVRSNWSRIVLPLVVFGVLASVWGGGVAAIVAMRRRALRA